MKKSLELLLMKDVPKLGKRGSLVKVNPGYARNYLIPQKLAFPATKENMRLLEVDKKRQVQQEVARKEQIKLVAQEMELSSCTIEAKANEDAHLFGSVTYAMIAQAFTDMGYEVKPEDLELEQPSLYPIKELGIFFVNVRLHPEVVAKSKVWVVNEQGGES